MYDLTITLSPVLFVLQWAQREKNPVGKIVSKRSACDTLGIHDGK